MSVTLPETNTLIHSPRYTYVYVNIYSIIPVHCLVLYTSLCSHTHFDANCIGQYKLTRMQGNVEKGMWT